MSIKNYVDELEQLQSEIKNNNTRNRILRQRVKELEANISEYLSEKDQKGVKYKGKAIIIEQKESRPVKKKKEREAGIISLFENLGVNDPRDAYTRLLDTQKGEPVKHNKIKFKKLPVF